MVLHVEGMTLSGNQSRWGKNTGRSLTLGEIFHGKDLWEVHKGGQKLVKGLVESRGLCLLFNINYALEEMLGKLL